MSVEYEVVDHVARVTIARPESYNAIDASTASALEEIWTQIEADSAVRVVVLTGAGNKAFCAGADMKSSGDEKSNMDYWEHRNPNGFGGLALRKTLHVPIIARVNGVAAGGGFEMVLGCDIVIAADHARFGLPEARVGRMPCDGGMLLLPRLIPEKRALGMLMTGELINAATAEKFGLVNEVVTEARLDETVESWTKKILACAPLSVKCIKECVRETASMPLEEAHFLKHPALVAALESDDANEGVLAFREKRAPDWKGR